MIFHSKLMPCKMEIKRDQSELSFSSSWSQINEVIADGIYASVSEFIAY